MAVGPVVPATEVEIWRLWHFANLRLMWRHLAENNNALFQGMTNVLNTVGTAAIYNSGFELRGLKFPFFRKFDPLLHKN